MTQARLKQADWSLEWTKQGSKYDIQVGSIISKLKAAKVELEVASAADAASASAQLVLLSKAYSSRAKKTNPGLATFMSKTKHNQFKMIVKLHHGEAFYETQPLPGSLHLLMRTVEKVVNLDGLLSLMLLKTQDAAVDAMSAIGLSAGITWPSPHSLAKLEPSICQRNNCHASCSATR